MDISPVVVSVVEYSKAPAKAISTFRSNYDPQLIGLQHTMDIHEADFNPKLDTRGRCPFIGTSERLPWVHLPYSNIEVDAMHFGLVCSHSYSRSLVCHLNSHATICLTLEAYRILS